MTLLEVLIAMGLAAIILSALTYFYRQVDSLNSEMDKLEQEQFKMAYVENRLADILPRAISPRDTERNDFYFFTSSDANGLLKEGAQSLVFTYDNRASLDKPFSYHVLGRLFLDKEGNFSLATWPSPFRWDLETKNSIPIKREILLENVESLSFQFYAAPEKNRDKIYNQAKKGSINKRESIEIIPKDHWHNEWKSQYHRLPAIIKITLKQVNNPTEINFVFPLPNSEMVIVYDK